MTSAILDTNLDIDVDALQNFNLLDVTSWTQVEMKCAINDVEINYDLLKFFLVGAFIFQNIYNMMRKAIERTDFLSDMLNKVETIEFIYAFMSSTNFIISKVSAQWYLVLQERYRDQMMDPSFDYEKNLNDEKAWKKRIYKLLVSIDKRFPLLLIQYFQKHKKFLMADKPFVEFIFRLVEIKSRSSELFKRIYKAMEIEREKIVNTNIFLS